LSSQAEVRFLDQLQEAHPEASAGVLDLLVGWQAAGGHLSFGRADETSCFLVIQAQSWHQDETWPMTIYPRAGSVEVVFQHMRRRRVFDDLALREEFRDRLAEAGIEIPDTKLSLRPSFSLSVLADDANRSAVNAALAWFAATYRAGVNPDIQPSDS